MLNRTHRTVTAQDTTGCRVIGLRLPLQRGEGRTGRREPSAGQHQRTAERRPNVGGATQLVLARAAAWPRSHRRMLVDVAAVVLSLLDMLLVFPKHSDLYSSLLTALACLVLVFRRRYPFLVLLATLPGFLTGWATLAGMIALYEVAKRRGWCWQTAAGAVMVMACDFVLWPLSDFLSLDWRELGLRVLWAGVRASMPLALGLLVTTRKELRRRIKELAAIREREETLQAMAIRAEERTKLARDMHDVVSHQVTLIAMQAGALKVTAQDDVSRDIATTIRTLSTRTLDELRQLVDVLRTPVESEHSPDLADLDRMVSDCGIPVTVTKRGPLEDLPRSVSGAAYRTVQEALTNVRKHASAAATSVLIQVNADELLVQVSNERPTGRRAPVLPSGGHGLLGLAERAELLGGSLTAGPRDDGGFVVTSRFPVTAGALVEAHRG